MLDEDDIAEALEEAKEKRVLIALRISPPTVAWISPFDRKDWWLFTKEVHTWVEEMEELYEQ